MVEREGLCLGLSPCTQSGGLITNTQQCVDECPEGQTQVGSVCSLECEAGQYERGAECVAECPEGEFVVSGKYCRANCPDGMLEENGSCLFPPGCPEGETRFEGVCTANEDLTQDDVMELCLDSLNRGDLPPDGMENASPEEQCAVLIEEACGEGHYAGSAACGEQSCPEGQAMFAGVCRNVGSCEAGQVQAEVPDADPPMQCLDSCPEPLVERLGGCISVGYCYNQGGTVYNDDQCVEQCPENAPTYNGRCYDQCPDGRVAGDDGTCVACASGEVAVDGVCVESCPEGSVQDGTQCVPSCPEDKVLFGGHCVYPGNCPEGEVEVGGDEAGVQCDDECPEGEVARLGACVGRSFCANQGGRWYNDECVEQCPEGAGSLFSYECYDQCPEGQVAVRQDDQTRACTPVDECLEDDFMVTYEGACIPRSGCSILGGVFGENRECYAECPEGTEQAGNTCRTVCPEGQENVGGECVIDCPAGQSLQDGQCADVQCDAGQELVGSQCLAPCAEGYVRQETYCAPAPCPGDEMRIDGVCTARSDVTYEDAIEECIGGLDQFPEVPADLEGATPREACESRVGQWCDGLQNYYENQAGDVLACQQRPCSEGLENVAGQCVAACAAGEERGPDGQCAVPACPEGEVRRQDGSCADSCPPGMNAQNGQCQPICGPNQMPIDGACRPIDEVEYDDFIEACEDSIEGGGAPLGQSPSGHDYSGNSPGRQCELAVELACTAGALSESDAALCADRDPVCDEDEMIAADGSCASACAEGQYVIDGARCGTQCEPPYAVLGNECRFGCPEGYNLVLGGAGGQHQCVSNEAPPPAEEEFHPPTSKCLRRQRRPLRPLRMTKHRRLEKMKRLHLQMR